MKKSIRILFYLHTSLCCTIEYFLILTSFPWSLFLVLHWSSNPARVEKFRLVLIGGIIQKKVWVAKGHASTDPPQLSKQRCSEAIKRRCFQDSMRCNVALLSCFTASIKKKQKIPQVLSIFRRTEGRNPKVIVWWALLTHIPIWL